MKTHNQLPSSHSLVESRFAYLFLKALKELNKNRPSSPSIRDTYRRYNLIRVSAYGLMASAVRPRRAWSRATLWKIRNRTFLRALMKRSRTRSLTRRVPARGNPKKGLGCKLVKDLRKLVPGGEEMKFCRLLNETAHYIKCLQAQVQIMRNIIDHSST